MRPVIQYRGVLSLHLTTLLLPFLLVMTASAQDAILVIKGETNSLARKKGMGLNAGVKAVDYKEEPVEGVTIELKKNGATVSTTKSGKKGKYSFEVPVSVTDAKNDYVALVTFTGMAPLELHINAYVPKDEFKKYSAPKYECEVPLVQIETSVKDIILDKPSKKIKWDLAKEHKFVLDPNHARLMIGEEQKMKANADAYFTAMMKKRQKKDDALAAKNKAAEAAKLKAEEEARKKAEEEARLKADEEARRLAALKAKEEADRLAAEALRKHIADSLALAAKNKVIETDANATVEINKIVRPVADQGQGSADTYDASETFSINIATRSLIASKEKRSKEKGRNLSAKYETINILTSLLDVVDETDKSSRKQ